MYPSYNNNNSFPRFEYFKTWNSQMAQYRWYWRLRDGNTKVVADGSQGYGSEAAVKEAIANIVSTVPTAASRVVPVSN